MRRASFVGCVLLVIACSRTNRDQVGTTQLTSATDDHPRSFVEPDPGLTRLAEAAITADPILGRAARNVEVTIDELGTATLRGSVPDNSYKREVEAAVKSVSGISRVVNNIDVSLVENVDETQSDERIAFSLQRSLATMFDAERVTIDVHQGRVTLRGTTNSASTADEIANIAQETPGVVTIVNELKTGP